MELRKKKHSVYSMTYHAVFVVKYRRKVITPEMNEFMKSKAAELMEGYGGTLIEMESDLDHVHLLFELPPSQAPSVIVCSLKTQLSKEVRKRFANEISGRLYGDAFWSASYFICTTGGVTIDILRQYVQSQPTEEHKRKYTKSGKYKKKS